jgi:hypothetical protein
MIDLEARKRRLRTFFLVCGSCAVLIFMCRSAANAQTHTTEQDHDAILALENEWLRSEHNAAALERILAPDFLHPVSTGDVLTKAEHIKFSSKRSPPAGVTKHFEGLHVRLYGDVGIVNGLVITTDKNGREVDKTVFTDVFVYREGRWQAVNAQENVVRKLSNPR